MNWLSKISNRKVFIGDCVSCLDDPNFNVAADATELAQIIDRSTALSMHEVFDMCLLGAVTENKIRHHRDAFQFGMDERTGTVWAYDADRDVHYFFR